MGWCHVRPLRGLYRGLRLRPEPSEKDQPWQVRRQDGAVAVRSAGQMSAFRVTLMTLDCFSLALFC